MKRNLKCAIMIKLVVFFRFLFFYTDRVLLFYAKIKTIIEEETAFEMQMHKKTDNRGK